MNKREILKGNWREDKMEEYKGFEIKCLNCGSTDVKEVHDYDYDWDENMIDLGTYLVCNNCGQCNR
jgi:uncharacterized OB-fold protein